MAAPRAGNIRTGPPVVTDISFLDQITNDLTGKSGWRIYRVTNIDSQLGCLGWDLLLNAPVDNRLIAIRANAVPGRRQYRSNDTLTSYSTEDRFDYSSSIGDLQRPGHQADVWYIGVYRPDTALGAFTLTTRLLTAESTAFRRGHSAGGKRGDKSKRQACGGIFGSRCRRGCWGGMCGW